MDPLLITVIDDENNDDKGSNGYLRHRRMPRVQVSLTLRMLGKIFSRRYTEIFFFLIFPRKQVRQFMQIVSNAGNLHKNVKSCFLGKIRRHRSPESG